MFNSSDLYSTSGGVTIFNYWNPFVTKHDTSSFYNWEQDNLPLYDLEERTEYLWEKLGYPLSSVPGMALVVSATIPDIAASANVFTSVSAAIEALPEIIRMPTLIEVAVSGNLGELNLNNIKCEGDGILEIINRAGAPLASNEDESFISTAQTGSSPWYVPSQVSATQVFGTLSSMSAISVSANTASVFYNDEAADARNIILAARRSHETGLTSYYPPYYAYPGVCQGTTNWRNTAATMLSSNSITPESPGTPLGSVIQDATITTNDVSCISELDGTLVSGMRYANNQLVNGLVTGNWFNSVKTQNCDGPIYIRNFIVDGENTYTTGFKVDNCANLTIENCGAMRCTTAGFDINNSTVNLRRQAFASRNYNATDRGTIKTYGFKVTNSEVDFVTDTYTSGVFAKLASHFHDYGIYLDNSVLRGGDVLTDLTMKANKTFSTEIGVNQTNLYLVNSRYAMDGITSVYESYNNIEAHDSTIEVEQLHSKYAQNAGLLMFNSSFSYNKNLNLNAVGQFSMINTVTNSGNYPLYFRKNGQHVILKGGSTYGPTYPNSTLSATESVTDITTMYNMEMYSEHQGAVYEAASNKLSKPAIVVDNSTAQFTCSKILCSGTASDYNFVYSSPAAILSTNNASVTVLGLANKNLNQNTICYTTGNKSRFSIGYLADKGSSIHFTGPNAIYNFGIPVAATNGSRVSIGVPLTKGGAPDFTTSGWGRGLHPAIPVMEIHSGRSCFVADNNSELIFKDVGNSMRYWSRVGNNINLSANPDYPYLGTYKDTLIASGALQFYPNSFSNSTISWVNTVDTAAKGSFRAAYGVDTFTQGGYTNTLTEDVSTSSLRILYNAEYTTLSANMMHISQGGMCVRATGGSNVQVRNVHFPTGWANTDGSYYDASSSPAGCDNLMIWNIADTSRLHASYVAVSGAYPSDAGYRGPRSFYSSGILGVGFSEDSSSVQYNVPSGTLHTGKLSVLDHFGSGTYVSANLTYEDYTPTSFATCSVWANTSATYTFMSSIQESRTSVSPPDYTYGELTAENQGPFRLYFSVSPAAKLLSYASAVGDPTTDPESNIPYQHLAQGYLLSGDCSGPKEFSGLYPQLLNKRLHDLSGILFTSGYYYPSELMPKDRADVWLDESAANLFSNAKHCNTDYSNRIKLVNIYRARIDNFGEAQSPDLSGHGLGFRSANIFDIDREI